MIRLSKSEAKEVYEHYISYQKNYQTLKWIGSMGSIVFLLITGISSSFDLGTIFIGFLCCLYVVGGSMREIQLAQQKIKKDIELNMKCKEKSVVISSSSWKGQVTLENKFKIDHSELEFEVRVGDCIVYSFLPTSKELLKAELSSKSIL